MYEWIQAGVNTWYMDCPTKVDLYQLPGDLFFFAIFPAEKA